MAELEDRMTELIAALDALDVDRMMAGAAEEVQGIDEISRRWIRGRGELESYLRQLADTVGAVHTTVRDVNEHVWGDTGLLTGFLEQTYVLEGAQQRISAPTTVVFRREGGEWKLALFH